MKRWGWTIAGIVVVTAGLRVAGMFGDLWLDEIWSWEIARGTRSAWVDNNHLLNTLWMYLLGDQREWWLYRVPAAVAGVGTVGLAAWYVGKTVGKVEGVLAAMLLGVSYPMVHYSSEARGYALAGLFAVVGFVAADRFMKTRGWGAAMLFWAAVVLGFLSHLTFVHFYLGVVVWSVVTLRSGEGLAKLHLVPGVSVVGLWVVFVRRMEVGGAPDTSLWDVVVTTLSVMGGGPMEGKGRAVVAILAAVVLIGALGMVWRERREWFWFLVTCAVGWPGVFVVGQWVMRRGGETLFPRYFLVSAVFGYVAVAVGLGVMWRRGWRSLIVAAAACFVAGSLWQTAGFLRGGRGHYSEAVAHMGAGGTVAGDDEFRTRMLVAFYAHELGMDVKYVGTGGEPEWFVINTPQAGRKPPEEVTVAGHPYRFEREFSYRGLSGWSWYLYRRDGTR